MKSEPPTGEQLTRLLVSMKRNVLEQVAQEPAPAKRMSVRRMLGLGLGVTALFGVGAGAAFALGVISAPQEDSATLDDGCLERAADPLRRESSTSVTAGQPASRYGLDCGTPGRSHPGVRPLRDRGRCDRSDHLGVRRRDRDPRRTAILAVGGSVCEWSNGVPMNDQYGVGPDYVGVTISVVPRATAGWSEYATHARDAGRGEPVRRDVVLGELSGRRRVGHCLGVRRRVLVADPPGWQSLVDAAVGAVSAAGPAAAPTMPERMTMPGSEDCDAVIPIDEVRSITATPDAQAMVGAGGWSEWAEAMLHADAVGCGWGVDDLSRVARVDWLHQGRWAYLRMLNAGTSTPMSSPGSPRATRHPFAATTGSARPAPSTSRSGGTGTT